jgi:transcriptional regulator with XRE-family HTH domain
MLDLGFPEAAGLYVYIDDHYINPFAPPPEAVSNGRSCNIGIREGFSQYLSNPDFGRYIDSGGFVYVDGHYVINDPAYVSRMPSGGSCLTERAKGHVNECCLGFSLVTDETAAPDVETYFETGLFRSAAPPYRRRPEFVDDERNRIVLSKSDELRRMHDELGEENAELADKVLSFSQRVRRHMKRKGIRYRSEFTERTLLSEKTVQRIVNDDSFKPGIDTVMAVAVGLDLGFPESERLFASAGYALEGPVRNRVFKKVLLSFHGHDIFSCNEALEALGEPPINETAYRDILGKKK